MSNIKRKQRKLLGNKEESPSNFKTCTNERETEDSKAIDLEQKEAYYKLQKGSVTNLASPTELNKRSAIKVVKQQISYTFNTKPKEKEMDKKEKVQLKHTNLTDLKPHETFN